MMPRTHHLGAVELDVHLGREEVPAVAYSGYPHATSHQVNHTEESPVFHPRDPSREQYQNGKLQINPCEGF